MFLTGEFCTRTAVTTCCSTAEEDKNIAVWALHVDWSSGFSRHNPAAVKETEQLH